MLLLLFLFISFFFIEKRRERNIKLAMIIIEAYHVPTLSSIERKKRRVRERQRDK